MQLMMFRPYAPAPNAVFPEGYTVRSMHPGEETLWSRACIGSFGIDSDSPAHYFPRMQGILPEDVLLLTYRDTEIAGTATAQTKDGRSYLHYVAIREEHRGRGLSHPLCAAVLARHDTLGHADGCFLTTDDHRLPAIAGYFKLGFLPVLRSNDALDRWNAVLRTLGKSNVRMLTPEDIDGDTRTCGGE
ncbi:MAG: GNAT family N-acetyltransferase [Clostridiaceae bacterium]|nr:GNAT family N-acetyltransferase [Clostridiaceae bacterium]